MRHTMRALLSMLLIFGCCQIVRAETSGWRLWPFGNTEEEATMPKAAVPTTTAPTFTPSPTVSTPVTTSPATTTPALPPSPAITPIEPQTSASPQSIATQYPPQAQLPAAQLPQTAMDSDRPPIIESPFKNMHWPKMKMPEWSLPKSRTEQPPTAHAENERPRNSWVQPTPEPPKPTVTQSLSNSAHRMGERTKAAWRKTVDAVTPGDPAPTTPPRVAAAEKPSLWNRMFGPKEPEPQGSQTIQGFIAQERLDP